MGGECGTNIVEKFIKVSDEETWRKKTNLKTQGEMARLP
jgi:hypothetical protein